MASNSVVAHRFANRDYNESLKGSSTHISGRNYYSYNTVFAQWVDLEKNVCLVYHGGTSTTSSKHKIYGSYFPDNVTVLPYDDGGYNSWHGCSMNSYGDWGLQHRYKLITYYAHHMVSCLRAIVSGTSKDLDVYAAREIREYCGYIMTLCNLYKDTSISKWLKDGHGSKEERKLIKLLKGGTTDDVPTLVNKLFGEGTFEAYDKYCERFRKAEKKRAQVIALCNRLGIANPYESYHRCVYTHGMTAAEIRKLSAKERLRLHWLALEVKDNYEHERERNAKLLQSKKNAYKWITGYEPTKLKRWSPDINVRYCRNMFSGVEYELPQSYFNGFNWAEKEVNFDYNAFQLATDKKAWIENFYAKCADVQYNYKAIQILKRIAAHTREKVHSWDDDRYIDDEHLKSITTEGEYLLCHRFIAKQDKYFTDKEARERAERIQREREAEERRKEKELQERLEQEEIEACIARGLDGYRDLWRKHYKEVYDAERMSGADNDFFYGGNVLLRFNMNRDRVVTSKGITLDTATCIKFFKLIQRWHEKPETFREVKINTHYSGTYTISSYANDILTAGCHKIAYAEMERMYNEIVAAV